MNGHLGMIQSVWTFWLRYTEDKIGVTGLSILVSMIFVAVLAPYLTPYDPRALDFEVFLPPSFSHLMGTDNLGRDLFSRITFGTRVALLYGFGVATLSFLLGVFIGAIPGYSGGLIDDLFSRFFDMVLAVPTFFFILVIVALFGSNMFLAIAVISLIEWVKNARIMRAQVLSLKSRGFVEAAVAAGAGNLRILFRHIVPNAVHPVLANSALLIAYAVLIEASLSFLGLGDVNYVSWGQVLFASQFYFSSAWWMAFFPGLMIAIFVLSANAVSDGIARVFNPRSRQR